MKTKFKSKFLSILLVLVMVSALVPMSALPVFADNNNVLSSASIEIPIPNAGDTSPAGIFFTSTEFNASIGWSTTADGDTLNDFNNQIFVEGNTYYADIYLTAKDTYVFAEGATVFVNGVGYTSVGMNSVDKRFAAVYDVPFTAVEHVEKEFTVKPTGATVGLNESYEITWQTNFEADEYKVLRYNVNTAQWETQATVAYKAGVNSCNVTSNIATAHLFKVQAFKNSQMVLESSQIDVIWSNEYRVSYLANGGSGEMDVVFISGKYTLGWCNFVPPEGYRFSHWTIAGQSYGQFEDITVTESIVVVANWLPVVTCLPLEIDGSAIGGAKTPDKAKLKNYLNVSDQVYMCGGALCCGMKYESDTWYDAETNQPATEFVDGKTYYYHIGVHPESGYLLPEINTSESDGAVATIKGIQWNSINTSVGSSDNHNKKCYEVDFFLKYDATKGIPLEKRTEIENIYIDGSELSGAKTPVGISEEKLKSDIFTICDESCDEIDPEVLAFNNRWVDLNNGNAVDSFIEGHVYMLYLMLHLEDGYKMPESISDDFVIIEGVKWEQQMVMGFGNSCMFAGAITYNAETGIPHSCMIKSVDEVKPTCTQDGCKAHYSCFCGKNFEDADGKTEIADLATWGAIKAEGHKYNEEWKSDESNHWNECACGDKANVAPHADENNDEKCDACSYAMSKAPSDNETEKPTEKPTDATDKPTDATDKPTDATDKPTDATDKPTDATDKPTDATESEKDDSTETEAPADNGCGGCGSSAALSALAIVAVVGSALVIKKKED